MRRKKLKNSCQTQEVSKKASQQEKEIVSEALKRGNRVQIISVNGNEKVLINGYYYFDNSKIFKTPELKGWVFNDIVNCIYRTFENHPKDVFPKCYNSYMFKKEIGFMDEVAYVDIDHCYLQVANKLGYINDKDYNRILKKYSEIKIDVCAAITSLFKEIKCTYIGNNKKIERVIECNNYFLETVRDNIINYSCSIMADWEGDYYNRNVDGIWIPIKELASIQRYLKEKSLKYKVYTGEYIEPSILYNKINGNLVFI